MSYSWTLSLSPAASAPLLAPGVYAGEGEEEQPDWGFDILTMPSLDMTWTPRRDHVMLADAIIRRFFTPRGSLWAYPTYGFDIRDYLNDEINRDTLSAIKGECEGQAEQDERVAAADARVTYDGESETVQVKMALESDLGPFSMVLSITAVSTTILLEG